MTTLDILNLARNALHEKWYRANEMLKKYPDNDIAKWKVGKAKEQLDEIERKIRIERLYEIMSNDLSVMAEHGDSEESLHNELENATPEILREYENTYLEV